MAAANRKKISDSESKRLKNNYPFLIDELDANRLTPHLFSLGVISLDEMEVIHLQIDNKGKKGGIVHLMKILFRSGNNPYEGFIESLTKEGYHHVVERLQSDVQNQSSEQDDYSRQIGDLLRKYNTQQQTIIRQQDAINQLNGEVKSLKGEVGCIKQQHKTENRPIPMEKMSAEESFDIDDAEAEREAARIEKARAKLRAKLIRESFFSDDEEAERFREVHEMYPQLFDCDDELMNWLAEMKAAGRPVTAAKLIEKAIEKAIENALQELVDRK